MSDFRKTLVGIAVVAAVAAGGVVGAGSAFAAAEPVAQAATNHESAALAVDNLGLSTGEAKSVQDFLIYKGYNPGPVDGQLGTASWKAMQRYLRDYRYGYQGKIDGIAGSETIKALQRRLADGFGYTGEIDGVAGPATKAAFKYFANFWS